MLEVPSDGNDAIWAVMQAMLTYENYLPVEITLSDKNEQNTMLYWRSKFAATSQNANEPHTRFSENHPRMWKILPTLHRRYSEILLL